MISIWWLLLIIPATIFCTLFAIGLCQAARKADDMAAREYEQMLAEIRANNLRKDGKA